MAQLWAKGEPDSTLVIGENTYQFDGEGYRRVTQKEADELEKSFYNVTIEEEVTKTSSKKGGDK